jgi:D-alanyl-D-alanine carboxypeptidase
LGAKEYGNEYMKRKWTRVPRLILVVLGCLAAISACYRAGTANFNATLDSLVADLAKNDSSVKNCVLSVASGDGSFSWSGAAGISHGQTAMTKESPIYIASVTKLYTATVVMHLYEQGALALDDPMAKYLPADVIRGINLYGGHDYSNEITIRQLLSHSSGIADYYEEKGSDGKTLFDKFFEDQGRSWTVDETIERARRDLKPNFPPGKGTSYSDTNFQLLGKVVEATTGKSLAAAYEEAIFRPLGLKHTYLLGYDQGLAQQSGAPADVFYKDTNITRIRSNGAYWAEGGIVSTADEMVAFLKALNEGRIIQKTSLSLMHDWHRWRFPMEYGLGTMFFSLPSPMRSLMKMPPLWGHSGSTGSFLYYCENDNLYLAGTIDQADSRTKPFFLIYKAISAVHRNHKAP